MSSHNRPKYTKSAAESELSEDRSIEETSDENVSLFYNQNVWLSLDEQRKRLPVYRFREQIEYLLDKYQTLVVIGETGCGKSTQIPQFLAQSYCQELDPTNGQLMVGVTEPRRVAAVSLANRVAQECDCRLGEDVGYAIRFEDCVSKEKTKIKFMTEGILINELMSDPLLTRYSAIVVDEAHERTVNTDILMALLKKIIRKRPTLKLLISSATIDAEVIKEYFNLNKTSDRSKDTSAVLVIEGRSHPVEVFYCANPIADYVKESVNTVIKIHEHYKFGDVLVFLTGQEEVETAVSILKDYSRGLRDRNDSSLRKMFVLPMYASLPTGDQMKVFETFPKSVRKVIVATNIAETSITINNICFIVDSGFVKMRFYDSSTSTDSLAVVPISQASAQQRAGRAGRERPGSAFRLYTEPDFEKLSPFSVPEIQRTDLSSVIIQLKALGINNIVKFDFISEPPEAHVVRALDLLYALEAIDDSGSLTDPLGLRMAEFPLHPMLTKMLFASQDFHCSDEALTICAVLQVQNIFSQPSSGQRAIQARRAKHNLSVQEGDLITYLNIYNLFIKEGKVRSWADRNYLNYKALLRVVELRKRLESVANRMRIKWKSTSDVDDIRKAIVCGLFANAAYYHPSGVYKTVRTDHELHIHPNSVLFTMPRPPKYVVFSEVLNTSKQFMRELTPIDPKWLTQLAPKYYQFGTDREIAEQRSSRK